MSLAIQTAARTFSGGHSGAGSNPMRVAVVCDFQEEQWPSMDLVGDMLCQHLAEHCGEVASVTQLRPRFHRRLTRFTLVNGTLAGNADRLINRFADYPRWLRVKCDDYDLFHIVDHSYSQLLHGLPAGRSVVTCHDLDTFRCLLQPERDRRPAWFRAMARRILNGFQQAAHVIAVSSATRKDLLAYNLFPPQRISVVPNGVHPSCSPLPNPAADAEAARYFQGAANDQVWLLSVGSTIARKRLDVLLRVLAAILQEIPQARLIRAGGFTPAQLELAAELKVQHAIVTVPFLQPDVLSAVYRRSTLLLHTAEAEGFGLPVIEALASGCPVVASDIPVLREVGGETLTYCRVGDVPAWKESVVRLIRESFQRPGAWQIRREHALARAGLYSWAENARHTAGIYHEVLCAMSRKS